MSIFVSLNFILAFCHVSKLYGGLVAQLEREYMLDRQREGIEIARQEGKYQGRKPIAVDEAKFEAVYAKWKSGECKGVEAMKELGLKASTFYRRIKQYEAQKNG